MQKLLFKKVTEQIHNPKQAEKLFKARLAFAVVFVLLLVGVLLANLYFLQIKNVDNYRTQSNGNRIKLLPKTPIRGVIYDRNGVVLAKNLTYFGLFMLPEKASQADQIFNSLKDIIELTPQEIDNFKKESQKSSKYTPILLKSDLNEAQRARFAVNQYRFPSLSVQPYFKRSYPVGEMFTHILGYVAKINEQDKKRLADENQLGNYTGTNSIGKLGIEKFYEDKLHGKTGFEVVEINSHGEVMRRLSSEEAVQGKNIKLTIDYRLQKYIFDLIKDKKGSVVVLDPKDSSILAMVTSPSYDNNLFVDGISATNFQNLLNDPNHPLYSRATQGLYPPASTIKPFIAVAGLTEEKITPETTIFDPGYWSIPNTRHRYRDWKKTGHGEINVIQAIAESSDTFFYGLSYDLGIDKISEWMQKFGFGQTTGLDLYEESQGIMPTRSWKQNKYKTPWLIGDTIPVGIGQGYWTATPLQLAKATAILINNGKANTPHLMHSVIGETEEKYQDQHKLPDIEDVKPETWKIAKQGMFDVINSKMGTARHPFVGTPYKVAGKTGTAQVFNLNGLFYNSAELSKNLHDHAWFIGYAPFDDPKLVVTVILENAGSGSIAAAPIARKIMDFVLVDNYQNKKSIK